jgi:hypothetical protein
MGRTGSKIFKASIFAGLLPGLIVPLVWPFVVFAVEGDYPSWSSYPMAMLTISYFSVAIGLGACIILGVPILWAASRLRLNIPLFIALIGGALGLILFLMVLRVPDTSPSSESWPIATLFVLMAAICGYVASYLSVHLKTDNET